jgi:hypothetical protein
MPVFTLNNTILLGCMWARHTMSNARATEVGMKAMILTTPIGLHSTNFSVKKQLNVFLEEIENVLNIRLMFN